MEYALPSTWTQGSRGFWTKRKKTATSLLAIMALVAGVAVAFKLFEQTVPNNVVRDASIFDFDVLVQRAANQGCTAPVQGGTYCDALQGNPIFPNTVFTNGVERPRSMFPGDSDTQNVRIVNTNKTPAKDASFETYVQNIVVSRCADADGSGGTSTGDFDPETGACIGATEVVPAGTDANRFINFFSLTVSKQVVYYSPLDETEVSTKAEACTGGLKEHTKASPCELGTIRASGTDGAQGENLDDRDYAFKVEEEDDGTDQSAFKGWFLTFDLVFQARVPAVDDASSVVGSR